MADAPGFGSRHVGPRRRIGERAYDRRGLGHFRVPWGINDGQTLRAGLSGERIARSRLAIEREVQDLAQRRVRILSRSHTLAIADRQEHRTAIGRERYLGTELAATAAQLRWQAALESNRSQEAVAEYYQAWGALLQEEARLQDMRTELEQIRRLATGAIAAREKTQTEFQVKGQTDKIEQLKSGGSPLNQPEPVCS